MYSNYEEFKVVRTVISEYATEREQEYTKHSTTFNYIFNHSTFDISKRGDLQSLMQVTEQMNACQQGYLRAQGVLNDLHQIFTSSYEMVAPLENQTDMAVLQEKADDKFLGVLAGKECSSILSEIAYSLYKENRFPIEITPSYNMEAINEREKQIESMLINGNIDKEQAIYWSIMQLALSNSDHFVEGVIEKTVTKTR